MIDLLAYIHSASVKVIVIQLDNSQHFVQIFKLLARQDCTIILLSPREQPAQLAKLKKNLVADLLISKQFSAELKTFDPEELLIEELSISDQMKAQIGVFSSGSEQGKLQIFNLSDLWEQARNFVDYFQLVGKTFILSLPISSIAGLNLLLRAWQANGKLVASLEQITSNSSNVLSLFPTQLRLWSNSNPQLLEILHTADRIFVGGERVDPVCSQIIKRYLLPVIETYALTEAGGTVAYRVFGEGHFTALPGWTFEVEDPEQESRLILVRTNPSAAPSKINTDDIACLKSPQEILTLRRRANSVNRGGFKFELEYLESLLCSAFVFEQLVCLKQSDQQFGENVCCYYQAKHDVSELEQWSKLNLEVYLRPKFSKIINWPLLPNGKTDIKSLQIGS